MHAAIRLSEPNSPAAHMLNGIDQYFAPFMSALDLRAQRSEVLAANIANADTPHYKARDIDFAAALRAAQSGTVGSRGPLPLERTSAQHLEPGHGRGAGADLKYRMPLQSSIDDNTVELDTELANFSDNSIRYQADLTFLSTRVRTLQQAITGQ